MVEKSGKNLIPIAIVVAGIIIGGAFIFVNQENTKGTTGKVLPVSLVVEETMNYINENLLGPGMTASLIDVLDMGSIYKIHLEIKQGEDFWGEFESYVSKDGEFLFPEGINTKEPLVQDLETEAPVETEAPSLPPEELKAFVDCLENKGMVIYGADWCPHCQQLVALLGGKEVVGSMYVNCEEQSELCQEKGITGYPTILINDKEYRGARSFESFAQETGCSLY